jgi:hypothetical protein
VHLTKTTILAVAGLGLAALPAIALQFPETCITPPATVTSITGIDTRDAMMDARFTLPDIVQACHQGYVDQANRPTDECIRLHRALVNSPPLHANADCVAGVVTVEGVRTVLPAHATVRAEAFARSPLLKSFVRRMAAQLKATINIGLYSLRHTAICMRIILSEGQVNIFNLAKNAGTSVDQIERFYARNLPPSKEMAINLQSFGVGEHTRIAHLVCHHPIFDPYFQYKFERETIFQNFACNSGFPFYRTKSKQPAALQEINDLTTNAHFFPHYGSWMSPNDLRYKSRLTTCHPKLAST